MDSKKSSRRRFLNQMKEGTVLAGLAAVGGIQVARDQTSGQSSTPPSGTSKTGN
jgi:hypothetical protein